MIKANTMKLQPLQKAVNLEEHFRMLICVNHGLILYKRGCRQKLGLNRKDRMHKIEEIEKALNLLDTYD